MAPKLVYISGLIASCALLLLAGGHLYSSNAPIEVLFAFISFILGGAKWKSNGTTLAGLFAPSLEGVDGAISLF